MEDFLEPMRNDVEILEKRIKAKREILEEVLLEIDTAENSTKRRNFVKEILSAEIQLQSPKNALIDWEIVSSRRFDVFTCLTMKVRNFSPNFDVFLELQTQKLIGECRWRLAETQHTFESIEVLRRNSTCFLFVSIPNAVFFNPNPCLYIDCSQMPENDGKLGADVYKIIGRNSFTTLEHQNIHVALKLAEQVVEIDGVEFLEENASIILAQCIIISFYRKSLKHPLEVQEFRQNIENFACSDFDKWQLFIGKQQHFGIFIIVEETDGCMIKQIYASNSSILHHFVTIIDQFQCS